VPAIVPSLYSAKWASLISALLQTIVAAVVTAREDSELTAQYETLLSAVCAPQCAA
jgi:hypothetical protein